MLFHPHYNWCNIIMEQIQCVQKVYLNIFENPHVFEPYVKVGGGVVIVIIQIEYVHIESEFTLI